MKIAVVLVMLFFAVLCSGALAGIDFEENGRLVYHDLAVVNVTTSGAMVDVTENQTLKFVFSNGWIRNIPVAVVRENAATSVELDFDISNSTMTLTMVTPSSECACTSDYEFMETIRNVTWVEVTGANVNGRLFGWYGKAFDGDQKYLSLHGNGTMRFQMYGPNEAKMDDTQDILKNVATLDLMPRHFFME